MPCVIELTGIRKSFGGVHALKGVDFSISPGEIHCLVGENGSGKSTLIKIMSGVHAPDSGEIRIDGTPRARLTPPESIAAGIQVIYQDLSLFPNLSVAENIGIRQYMEKGRRLVDRRRLRKSADDAMRRIGVSLDPDRPVRELSIADRQLVAICRAIAEDARLVIMDEPTASLTRAEVDALLSVVRDLQRRDLAILFVSHRLDEVMEIARRVTVLRDGETAGVYDARELDDARLAFLMTGKQFTWDINRTPCDANAPLLEVRNLSKKRNYADISFTLHRGEILGVTGLLGSGRTELALSLFGCSAPDSGEIRVEGRAVRLESNRDAIRAGIGYLPEDRLTLGLVLDQSTGDNAVLTILDSLVGRGGLIDCRRLDATVRQWIESLNIKVSDPAAPVRTLSGGNQQKVVLAKWLATNPKVLILDSPTVGVDVAAKHGIFEIVRALAAKGMGIILISDEVPEVLCNAHRVLLMRKGRIVGEYRPDSISQKELAVKINAE